MSRYIEVNAFYDKMYEWVRIHGGIIRNEMQAILEATPSIDIVRCRECKHFIDNLIEDDTDEAYDSCRWDWSRKIPTADDFCSYGEREDE